MSEILSQNEIDSLLNSISEHNTGRLSESQLSTNRIKMYDFRHPDKFSIEQITVLQIIHEKFARRVTQTLFTTLNIQSNIHIASVDQLAYEEFIHSIPYPSTFTVFSPHPLDGMAVLEIDPVLSFAMIDKMLGGSGSKKEIIRGHTSLELKLLENIVIDILQCFAEEWSNIFPFDPQISRLETDPHLAVIVPPDEMVILITFETKIRDSEGMINLCLPYLTIETLLPLLTGFSNMLQQKKESKAHTASPTQNVKTCVQREMFRIKTPLCSWSNLDKVKCNENYPIASVISKEDVFSPLPEQEV